MTFSTTLVAMTYLALAFGSDEVKSEPPNQPFTITTLAGEKYTNVQVRRVRPDAVVFFHDKGAASIPLEELTPELREYFDYDPEKAAAAARIEAAKQWAIRQRIAAELTASYEAEAERIRRWEDQQAKIKIAQLESLTARYQAEAAAQTAAAAAAMSSEPYGQSYGGYPYGYGDQGIYRAPFRRNSSSQCEAPYSAPVQVNHHPPSHHNTGRPSIKQGARMAAPAPPTRSSGGGGARQ